MSLVALAVAQTSLRLVAAPPDGPGSTADSDRKFLSNLENKEAAQQAPAEPAPQPQVVPAPVQPAAPAAQSRPHATRSQTATNGNPSAVAPDHDAPAPRPAKSVTRSVAAVPRTEAAQTQTTATAPVRREVAEELTSDGQTNGGPGASARIYRSHPGDAVTVTSPRNVTRRARNVAVEEEGTHIVQPAEIAQYGVAPTVPTKTTKVTTTYVQQPTTVVRKEDRDENHDEDHGNERNFFHRLFHGGLFNKHGDD